MLQMSVTKTEGVNTVIALVRVLVVDDSAFVRKAVSQILSRSPFIEVVGIAGDGEEALEKVERLHPDVVTLDLMMPGMGGLEFLMRQMTLSPLPIVVVSTASSNHDLVLKALEAGAVDFVHKPSQLAAATLFEMSEELIGKVKAAGAIRLNRFEPRALTPAPGTDFGSFRGAGIVDAIVIGISTGGPQGLKYLIPEFAKNFPVPIAVVMHMPVGYTEMFADKLNTFSNLKVKEAKEGDPFRAGVVLIAPGGWHLTFRRTSDGAVVAHLDLRPYETLHRPSVDVLFESAAEIFGARTLGVVMTGMGSDGLMGASCIKAQSGHVFTEAEETCVVYGMPAAVVEAGFSDRSVPLGRMASAIREVV
jgi:two-component system, chemotaxis family, protein-glutamate methylesterase/glutaminase